MLHQTNLKQCAICAATLDRHQAVRSEVCQKSECVRLYAGQQAQLRTSRREKNRRLAKKRAAALTSSLMTTGKLARRGDFRIATVPAWNNPPGPASPERQLKFQQHLDELLAQWVATTEEISADVSEAGTALESGPELNLLLQACATCRGECCQYGSTHAFLKLENIRNWFALNPESSLEECRHAYLSKLAEINYENSCVFHGVTGCGLPRNLRSRTCNHFSCRDLDRVLLERKANPAATTVIAAGSGAGVHRINVVDSASGERLEDELEFKT